jgi:small subunit ribosomal protein S1
MKDKSGIVALPYGVEGICPSKHLRKEDGSNAKVEDTLDFKVIEFNKDAKKIVLSHTRLFEEGDDKPTTPSKGGKKTTGNSTDQAVKAINQSAEKSTLGDLDALAELKEKMERGE